MKHPAVVRGPQKHKLAVLTDNTSLLLVDCCLNSILPSKRKQRASGLIDELGGQTINEFVRPALGANMICATALAITLPAIERATRSTLLTTNVALIAATDGVTIHHIHLSIMKSNHWSKTSLLGRRLSLSSQTGLLLSLQLRKSVGRKKRSLVSLIQLISIIPTQPSQHTVFNEKRASLVKGVGTRTITDLN
jgi:hypothetical protein